MLNYTLNGWENHFFALVDVWQKGRIIENFEFLVPYIKGGPYMFHENLWKNVTICGYIVLFVCWGVVCIEYQLIAMFHIVLHMFIEFQCYWFEICGNSLNS